MVYKSYYFLDGMKQFYKAYQVRNLFVTFRQINYRPKQWSTVEKIDSVDYKRFYNIKRIVSRSQPTVETWSLFFDIKTGNELFPQELHKLLHEQNFKNKMNNLLDSK